MSRCLIVAGAPIQAYDRLRSLIRPDDYIICCDCGLRHCEPLGITPDLIIGDFDSYEKPENSIETLVLPREKDDTDSFFAVKEAIRRGYDDFLLLGVFGGRFDHSLGNVSILLYLDSLGKTAIALDDYSEFSIISHDPAYVLDSFPFFSILNVTGVARGITIQNAKYSLEQGEITCDYQFGVSNEVLPGYTAKITIQEGRLLLIKDYE